MQRPQFHRPHPVVDLFFQLIWYDCLYCCLKLQKPTNKTEYKEISASCKAIRESGIHNTFACGLRHPEKIGLGNPESQKTDLLKSAIHCGGILDPVPGIRSPHHGIRNPLGGILNPVPGIRSSHHGIRNPRLARITLDGTKIESNESHTASLLRCPWPQFIKKPDKNKFKDIKILWSSFLFFHVKESKHFKRMWNSRAKMASTLLFECSMVYAGAR